MMCVSSVVHQELPRAEEEAAILGQVLGAQIEHNNTDVTRTRVSMLLAESPWQQKPPRAGAVWPEM